MKSLSAVIVLVAALALPATSLAHDHHADKRAAIASCKAERGKSKATRRAFRSKYHGFSRCIHGSKSAAHECRTERSDDDFPATHGDKSFEDFYGANHNHRNAFGKCVSAKVDDETGEGSDDHGGKCDEEHGSRHDD
jgi:hypothetical protein